jgi:hypothetical protein
MSIYDSQIREAVRLYWRTRDAQVNNQVARGISDQGARSAMTGGKQMDGFVGIVKEILQDCDISFDEVFYNSRLELPGYYRPEKRWDVLVVAESRLVAAIEFKSMASSFGNNFNNRVEEALGSATDLWTAYREGTFPVFPRPWLGYLMLLVECEDSTRPVSVREPHFDVLPEFKKASYADRYCILLEKLMRERLYSATCFLMTSEDACQTGEYREPNSGLSFQCFAESLRSSVAGFQRLNNGTS